MFHYPTKYRITKTVQPHVPIAVAHAEKWLQDRAPSLLDMLAKPMQRSGLQAGTIHAPEVMPADGFDIRSLSGRDPIVSWFGP